ncbi:hypothetical protein J6590_014161 [Homalodisca vitripennis]|nr:hypothetical protein J6590_014161 [Homalodisca vitripennis]
MVGGLAKDNIDINNKLDHVVSQNERLGDQIVNLKQKQSLVKAVTIDLEQPTDRLVTVNEDINLNVTNGSNESYQDMDISRHRTLSTSKSLDNVCEAKRPTYSSVVASKSSALNINTFKPTKKQVRQTAAPLIGTKARASEGDNNLKTVVRYPTERKSWVFVSTFTPEVTIEILKRYLSDNGVEDAICELLKTKYDTYKSFKIGLRDRDLELVLNEEFW